MKDLLVNDKIVARQIRLVDDDGKQVGIFLTRDAVQRARNSGLDLVQMGYDDTPVCKIIDAGKYMFDRKRGIKEAAKRQRELAVETKEVQLRPVTDTNDLMVKAVRTQGFLLDGDKVKVVVRFRGRERAHKDIGRKVVDEFLAMVGDHKVEKDLTDTGKDMQMILAPIKSKADLVRERNSGEKPIADGV